MSVCKFCSKPIVWVVKEDGKSHPFNAGDLTPHTCEGNQRTAGGNKGGYPPRDPKVQTYIIRQSCLDRATQIVLHGAAVESELPALVKDIKEIAEVLEGWVMR